jgi:hypothetical protein
MRHKDIIMSYQEAHSESKEAPLFEKAAQKLLSRWAMGCVGDNAHGPD